MSPSFVITGILIIAIGYVLIPAILPPLVVSLRHRDVVCPVVHSPVRVKTSPMSQIAASFNRGEPKVVACSRWPEAAGCDQACARALRV